jgi:low temperature requirement protein LtrA
MAVVLGRPALFLVGDYLFRMRVTGAADAKRLAVAAPLVLLAPLGASISALALGAMVGAPMIGLALWELPPTVRSLGVRLGSATDAPSARRGRSSQRQPQQEGSSS